MGRQWGAVLWGRVWCQVKKAQKVLQVLLFIRWLNLSPPCLLHTWSACHIKKGKFIWVLIAHKNYSRRVDCFFSIMADWVGKRTFTFLVFLRRGLGNRSSLSGIAINGNDHGDGLHGNEKLGQYPLSTRASRVHSIGSSGKILSARIFHNCNQISSSLWK